MRNHKLWLAPPANFHQPSGLKDAKHVRGFKPFLAAFRNRRLERYVRDWLESHRQKQPQLDFPFAKASSGLTKPSGA